MYVMQFLFPALCLAGLAFLLRMGMVSPWSAPVNNALFLVTPVTLALGGYLFLHERALTERQAAGLVAGDMYVFEVSPLSAEGDAGADASVLRVLGSTDACGPAPRTIGGRGLSRIGATVTVRSVTGDGEVGMEAVAATGTRTGCTLTLGGDTHEVVRALRGARAFVPGHKGIELP